MTKQEASDMIGMNSICNILSFVHVQRFGDSKIADSCILQIRPMRHIFSIFHAVMPIVNISLLRQDFKFNSINNCKDQFRLCNVPSLHIQLNQLTTIK